MAPLRSKLVAGAAGGAITAGGVFSIIALLSGHCFSWQGALVAGLWGAFQGARSGSRASDAKKAFLDGMEVGFPVALSALQTHADTRRHVPDTLCAGSETHCRVCLSTHTHTHTVQARPAWHATTSNHLAASCDVCDKPMVMGQEWYHKRSTLEDLCVKHRSELPKAQRRKFKLVYCADVLGDDWSAYQLTVRVPPGAFPQFSGQPEGTVVLEVSHLVNTNGKETHATMLRSAMPGVALKEVEGSRGFARVEANVNDEAALREVIKGLGRQRGKTVSVKVVDRTFNSPRD